MWQVEFESAEFLPYLPEQCQGNPGVYGFELAHWLSGALMQQGIATSYPLGEDWGWMIEYLSVADAIEVIIGCSSMADEGEGYQGKPITWGIFIRPSLSIKQRVLGTSPSSVVGFLSEAILNALAAKGINYQLVT